MWRSSLCNFGHFASFLEQGNGHVILSANYEVLEEGRATEQASYSFHSRMTGILQRVRLLGPTTQGEPANCHKGFG